MPPLRRAIALLVLLLYVTLGTVGVRMVLCTGQGGHTAVEWLGADCCVAPMEAAAVAASVCESATDSHGCPDAHASSHGTDEAPDGEDCGDCEDVTLARLIASPRIDLESDVPPTPPAPAVTTRETDGGSFARGPPAALPVDRWEPPPVPDPLGSRTVLRL